MRSMRPARGGFTLAEVLLASTITVMITLVAVSALKGVSDTSQVIDRTPQTTSALRFAAQLIARDLANFYRDSDSQNMLLTALSPEGASETERPSLRFYAVGRAKARPAQPEGDVYEVEYMLGEPRRSNAAPSLDTESTKRTLYRRWCPNPDRKREAGGILTPIAENIDVFQTRFYDGRQWTDQWTQEQQQELPQLLEVTVGVLPQGRGAPTVESFLVSFARMPKGGAGSAPGQGTPGQSGESGPQEGSSQESEPSGPPNPGQGSGGR
jgi:general secretion pathway protein J